MLAKVTTSWDDGHASDPRLAELLASKGMAGTFYWTLQHPEFRYPDGAATRDMLDMGMEIGAHTMTHPDLTKLSAADLEWELQASKAQLEEYITRPVRTFCYPFGYFNRRVRDAVEGAGYELARTTESFRTSIGTDLHLIPVTVQVYPHTPMTHLSHALRRGNLGGLALWLVRHRATTSLDAIVAKALDRVRSNGGVLHIWGHSWELDQFDLWATFERLLDTVAHRDDVAYVTNEALI